MPQRTLFSIFSFLLLIAIMLFGAYRLNDGSFAYAIDDAYIHLSVSKNLTLYQLWAVTPYEFSSSSSSMLWPLLNALPMMLFGVDSIYPLLLNILLSFGVIWFIGRILPPSTAYFQPLLILGIALLIPLPALTFLGLEHILHTLLTLTFAWVSARFLSTDTPTNRQHMWLIALGVLLPLARYEGLFLVTIVLVLLLMRGQWRAAVLLGGLAALPVVIFGRYSVAQGWLFLPNSVLIKGNATTFSLSGVLDLLQHTIDALHEAYVLTPLLLIAFYHFAKHPIEQFWQQRQQLRLLFILATLAHLPFVFVAKGSHLDALRYDAYLVAFGLIVVAFDLLQYNIALHPVALIRIQFVELTRSPKSLIVVAVCLLFVLPFLSRSLDSIGRTVLSMNNVYERQVQIGRFLATYYNEQPIVANDIGAINFYADLHLIDLVGLGTIETVHLMESGNFDRENFHALARNKNAQIAIIFDSWAEALIGGIPDQWQLVGRWGIDNHAHPDDNRFVSFYAIVPEQIDPLRQQLESFHPTLPPNVIYGINPDVE